MKLLRDSEKLVENIHCDDAENKTRIFFFKFLAKYNATKNPINYNFLLD